MGDFRIRRAAVLGAGTMGSRIAAHLANAGIPVYLLDLAPAEITQAEAARGLTLDAPEVRNRLVQAGWKTALQASPPSLFCPERSALVQVGNFADNLPWVQDADWVVEAVTERLDVKRRLLEQVERLLKPGTIVSTNTSGIPVSRIAEGFPEHFRRNFLGTHFFNPPRYLKLLELIPTTDTAPEVTEFMTSFGRTALGKGVVVCRDTPSFIANRVGTYGACTVLHSVVEEGFTVEEADALTGPLIGRPRSATFRTFDVIGLDTLALVAGNLYEALPGDPERETFRMPEFFEIMLRNGWLGEKTKQGFYKRAGSKDGEILFLDYNRMEYLPREKPTFPELDKAARTVDTAARLRALVSAPGRSGRFLWKVLSSGMWYAATVAPEIADDVTNIDNAMKWGFGHSLGPFETWDALGVKHSASRLEGEGRPVPPLVQSLLNSGKNAFYRRRSGKTYVFQPRPGSYTAVDDDPGQSLLSTARTGNKTVLQNAAASLIDLGDGVACLEFHSKMNTIDAHVLRMADESIDEVERNFAGMVIANEGDNFSAGANLYEILVAAREARWDTIETMIREFQRVNMRLRYSDKPVVAAPHNLTLGGACEISVHADRIHASAELYMGFVETGVGLIPAAGGCKEMVMRAAEEAGSASDMDLMPRIRRVFELIAMARVSTSALDARQLGILRGSDHCSMNPAARIEDARQDVLALAREGYRPPVPRSDIPVLGQPGLATLKLGIHLMLRAGYISEYDAVIGRQLARVLTGGSFPGVQRVSEQHLLELEREAFLSLCGRPETQQRIEHMLKTGKPLRN
jgi:3-hydroxyacyl-CoA dehydrogenase